MSYRDRRRDNGLFSEISIYLYDCFKDDDDEIAAKRIRGDGKGDHEDLSHKIHRLVVQMGDPVRRHLRK